MVTGPSSYPQALRRPECLGKLWDCNIGRYALVSFVREEHHNTQPSESEAYSHT
jgi:hypothetical protein